MMVAMMRFLISSSAMVMKLPVQITASVEKQQADRGVQIMGTEVYSY